MERNEPSAAATHRPRATAWALAAVLLGLAAGAATAQTVKETLEVTRQAIESQRRVLVSGAGARQDCEMRSRRGPGGRR